MKFNQDSKENIGKTRRVDVFYKGKDFETFLFNDEREVRLFLARHDFGNFDMLFFMKRVNNSTSETAYFELEDYYKA